MEKARPKPKTKMTKKKAKDETSDEPEMTKSVDGSTSLFDELHHAMQDFNLTEEASKEIEETNPQKLVGDNTELSSELGISEQPPSLSSKLETALQPSQMSSELGISEQPSPLHAELETVIQPSPLSSELESVIQPSPLSSELDNTMQPSTPSLELETEVQLSPETSTKCHDTQPVVNQNLLPNVPSKVREKSDITTETANTDTSDIKSSEINAETLVDKTEVTETSENQPLSLEPYTKVRNLLKDVVESENEVTPIAASAPIVEDQNADVASASAPAFIQYEHHIIEPLKPYLNNEMLKIIQPFTESQLSSLYHNHEIDFSKEYVKEFIESQKSLQNHKLYEMLSTYLRSRNKLIATQLEIDDFTKEYKAHQEQIWTNEDVIVSESGKCQDGNTVTASHKYPVANINKQSLNLVSRNLSSIRDLINEVHTLHAYSSEVLRLQIEHYMQEILEYYSNIPHNTPVQLYPSNNIQKTELCTCISVLFMFQRRQIKDEQFLSDIKDWLLKLGAMLLRIATARDHLFLLHHILRSPGGVTNWAISLIQIPVDILPDSYPSTSSALLDHAIAVLSVLMNPINERDQFIDDKRSLEDQWTFLDSDGDEDEEQRGHLALLENDLVAVLNQIPIDSIFRHVLGIQHRDNKEFYRLENISENNLLQLIAFATTVVQLLRTGLQTYNTPRYRQFAKRLGRLVRHTVQYVSEQWEMFRNCDVRRADPAMLARLQVEYDSLLLRATQCIFSSQRLGAWQFLAVVPYNVVSSPMLWRLFCLLHQEYHENNSFSSAVHHNTDWRAEMGKPQLREEFEAKLSVLPEAETYFLLTTFASMALARGPDDHDFILAATLDLFQVGFVSKSTQDSCCKTSRSLLSNLTSKHPGLISALLDSLKSNLDAVGSLSLYLVKELPLQLWTPGPADMTTLSEWLLSSPNSLQSSVARCILASLDWSTLPGTLQLHAALLAVDACLRHAPERAGHTSPGGVAEGVSSLAAMVRTQTSPEQGLNLWAWGLLSRLRLHLNDRHTWTHPPEVLRTIPDFEIDESLEVLARGVREKEPIACFAALLATTWGHSVPLICSKGVPLLATLLSHSKYDAVCEALHHITPFFLECPDSLTTNDKFLSLMISLITADRGYVKMAKNLLLADTPGPVLRQVANMIESQFSNSQRCGLTSPHPLTELWVCVLTSLPDWTREPSVSHLLDLTLRASYLHPVAREVASSKLRNLYKNGVARQGGALSSLFSWVSGSGSSSLLPRTACPEAPWLALYVMEMEQDENETRTGLWRQLLLELADQSRPTVDQAIKKAANALKVPAVPVGGLALYRWAQQALDTCLDHPLLTIFWQRFFTLYLARIPIGPEGGPDRGCIGHRFFEGLVNVSYVKRLRRRLYDAAELYDARAAEPGVSGEGAEEEGGDRRATHARTSRMLRTFGLWLEEPRLQEPNVYLPALPPQYDPNRLALIFSGDVSPWLEFVDLLEIQEKQFDAVRDWQLQHFRHMDGSFRMPALRKGDELASPIDRMMKRLHSYDKPLPAPAIKALKPVVAYLVREELVNQGMTLDNLERQFKTLLEFAQVHALRTSELAALDCGLLELLPALYRHTEVKVTLISACEPSAKKKTPASECAGPFRVTIKVRESRVNESSQHHIQQNRNEHKGLLSRSLHPPPQGVCGAAVYTENLVSKLVMETQAATQRQDAATTMRLRDTGVTLFYHLVSKYNEESAFYPPTKQLLTSCIEMLGQVFISHDQAQCDRLLNSILSHPHLSGLLSPHFSPQLAPTPVFLAMYQKVTSVCQASPDTSFAILSKFDVSQWLLHWRPRLRERSQFIETLGEALTASGREPQQDRLVLHETFLRHLRHILVHDFPEHYGEVLQLVLKSSEAQTLALDVWWSLVDALTPPDQPRLRPGVGLRDQLRLYATQQRMLGPQEVRETAALLASYFTKERLQYGLHGLYPKYRHYVEPLSIFMGMIGHSFIIGTLHQGRGALGDTLSEQMWPMLNELFSPWITPYTGQKIRQQSASWIQQLSDDRTVLLPWTPQDGNLAKMMTECFVDILQFLLDTLPACSNMLCFVWQFYVTHYTGATVKEHVLNVLHASFNTLPWERFWPRGQDVDAMLKVVEQYLPNCHAFLGSVFVQVPWVSWVVQVQTSCAVETVARTHVTLLHLLVKLAAEPAIKQNSRVLPLLAECTQHLAWHLVDSACFDLGLNWFVMSCDPRVILASCPDIHPVDVAVLELLQQVAGYSPETRHFHSTTVRKRLAFVRACAKLLVSSSSRFKSLLVKNQEQFTGAAHRLLDQVETVIHQTVPAGQQVAESSLLLGELLSATSVSAPLAAVLVPASREWLGRRTGHSVVVLGLLRTLGVSVTDHKALGTLMEETLEAFFRDTTAPNISWMHAVSILQPAAPTPKSQQQAWEPLEHTLVKDGNLLSLHAFLLKRNPRDKSDQVAMLASLTEWMSAVKLSGNTERKLPLLWKLAFSLTLSLCQKSVLEDGTLETSVVQKLNQLAQYFTAVGEDRGWDLLGAIGLRKQAQASVKLRLLARTLAAFLLVQLPTSGDGDKRRVRLSADSPGALADISSSCLSEALEPPAPSSQALQAVASLEAMGSAKLSPPELRGTLDQALTSVRDPANSLSTFDVVFYPLLSQLYQDSYLTL